MEQIKVLKPDYIIHTGDLFHRSSPSNRAITFALKQFAIIDELGIPFIIIAGNHSTPRTNLSSPILKIFDNFKNIYTSYAQKYKKVEFDDIIFHTLPHMNDETKAVEEIRRCESEVDESKANVMMMHCSVGSHYLMQEFGEWVYPKDKEYIFSKMSYVALGHWHGFGRVGKFENVYYSGSTERTSLNDKRNSKGFIELDISETLHVEHIEINIRAIVTKEIDCEDYENSLGLLHVEDSVDAIVEVKLKNLTPLQSIDISNSEIKNLFKDVMSVTIKREFKVDNKSNDTLHVESMNLELHFLEHLKDDANSDEFARLESKVKELFAEYEEKN